MRNDLLNDLEFAGEFTVDSGQAMVGDPCYLYDWDTSRGVEFDDNSIVGEYSYNGVSATTVKHNFGIVGEPTSEKSIGDTLKVGRRGSINFDLIVSGVQGHVAYPEKAVNPNSKMIEILSVLKMIEWDLGSKYFDKSNSDNSKTKEEIINSMLVYYLTCQDRAIYKKTDYLCNEREKFCICNTHADDFRKIYNGNYKEGDKFISWFREKKHRF